MKHTDTGEKGPCEAWRYIGVPKVKCQHCHAWFIEDTSRHPEFCSDECYGSFFEFDEDRETMPC